MTKEEIEEFAKRIRKRLIQSAEFTHPFGVIPRTINKIIEEELEKQK